LNNIYGVDVDPQAVEVAQLSLYLKLLEDETTATARSHQLEFKETLLPPLNRNIICGNSLIENDIFEEPLFKKEEERQLRPMDFKSQFRNVFKDGGGFDAIVGNPPLCPSAQSYSDTQEVLLAALSGLQEKGRHLYLLYSTFD
jgi:adenine-specific DNA-methyltransferase